MACGWFMRDLGCVEALLLLFQTLSGMLLSCDSRAIKDCTKQSVSVLLCSNVDGSV